DVLVLGQHPHLVGNRTHARRLDRDHLLDRRRPLEIEAARHDAVELAETQHDADLARVDDFPTRRTDPDQHERQYGDRNAATRAAGAAAAEQAPYALAQSPQHVFHVRRRFLPLPGITLAASRFIPGHRRLRRCIARAHAATPRHVAVCNLGCCGIVWFMAKRCEARAETRPQAWPIACLSQAPSGVPNRGSKSARGASISSSQPLSAGRSLATSPCANRRARRRPASSGTRSQQCTRSRISVRASVSRKRSRPCPVTAETHTRGVVPPSTMSMRGAGAPSPFAGSLSSLL